MPYRKKGNWISPLDVPGLLHASDKISRSTVGISLLSTIPRHQSVHLHRIISVKRLALRLDWYSSATTRKQLSPYLWADGEVAVSEQKVQ